MLPPENDALIAPQGQNLQPWLLLEPVGESCGRACLVIRLFTPGDWPLVTKSRGFFSFAKISLSKVEYRMSGFVAVALSTKDKGDWSEGKRELSETSREPLS